MIAAPRHVQADCFSGSFWQESVEDGTFEYGRQHGAQGCLDTAEYVR